MLIMTMCNLDELWAQTKPSCIEITLVPRAKWGFHLMEFLYLLAISYSTPQSFFLYISFFPIILGGGGDGA